MCTSEKKCCDESYNCCVTIETFDRWEVIKKDEYERIVINEASFSVLNKNRVVVSEFTTDQVVDTKMLCAIRCSSEEKCCVASYDTSTSICRLDTSENCCVDIEIVDGWETFKTDKYETPCTGCISYGTSSYKFSEDYKPWNGAKISCVCFGGKFLEAETTEENNFIKAELVTRNTGINGYWLGGYNFNKDGNLEWISSPDQPMTYSDMNPGEPSGPTTQRCLVYWRAFGYAWGDAYCSAELPYVCEFIKNIDNHEHRFIVRCLSLFLIYMLFKRGELMGILQ
ncbi:unnamed protein product [Mytilus edulis]|uniref:C-type lectin domain-containing protein n=1 Tax=Mytilus edulis TaxID=6550 RepID=A0A8S3VRH0_MYTED|nr:unnamed protein product [Mytilus edulis]